MSTEVPTEPTPGSSKEPPSTLELSPSSIEAIANVVARKLAEENPLRSGPAAPGKGKVQVPQDHTCRLVPSHGHTTKLTHGLAHTLTVARSPINRLTHSHTHSFTHPCIFPLRQFRSQL